ncbi:MAG TPA: sigma-70 family RNA polymerase sigma factor [Anaerolineaceae bacterium]
MDSDQPLLAARQLEPKHLAEIHDQFYPVVFRYVRFRLDDEHVCEDIAGEVFLRLVDAIHRQRGPIQNPRAWLIGTASHLVNDHLRARYHHPMTPLEEKEIVDGALPEDEVDRGFTQIRVREAMRSLTEDQQHVLALRFAEEYSVEETARQMGKTVGAIKTLQFRALGSLRRLLVLKEKS